MLGGNLKYLNKWLFKIPIHPCFSLLNGGIKIFLKYYWNPSNEFPLPIFTYWLKIYEWCMNGVWSSLATCYVTVSVGKCWKKFILWSTLVYLYLKTSIKKSKKESFFVLKIYPEKLEKLCVCVIHAFEMTSLIKYHYGHIFFNLYN